MDWGLGFKDALRERVDYENSLIIRANGISRVFQNKTPNENWITNFNVRGYVEIGEGRGVHWFAREDVLGGKIPLRTADTAIAVRQSYNSEKYDLDSICVNFNGKSQGLTAKLADDPLGVTPFEVGVYSMVIKCKDEYLLMECGREERSRGTFSLIGGKIDRGLGLVEGVMKEAFEETLQSIWPIGIVGVYVNLSRGRAVPNICTYAEVPEKFEREPNDEVAGLSWHSLDQIRRISGEVFRTPDTLQAITRADYLERNSQLLPLHFVETIRNN